jgi:hypothetical protein
VTGSLALHELASPGTTQGTNKLTNWLIVYRTVSLSLCVILTSLIASRLITIYRRSPGLCHTRSPLKDVALMLAESAILEIVFTSVYVITVGLGSPLQNIFLPILGQIQVKHIRHESSFFLYDVWNSQVIAPMLVIYRVVRRSREEMIGVTKRLRVNTAVSFASTDYESLAPPTMSIRGCDSPIPPPYAKDALSDFSIRTVPQTPTAKPAHIWCRSWV